MQSRGIGPTGSTSRWGTRIGLALAGAFGGLLFVYFLVGFVSIAARTQPLTTLWKILYFGTPALELLVVLVALLMGRRGGASTIRNVLVAVWLANLLNIVLAAIGFFGI